MVSGLLKRSSSLVHSGTSLRGASTSSSSSDLSTFQKERIYATHQWFQKVVIGQKLCPFAPPFVKSPELLRIVCPRNDQNNNMPMTITKAIEFVQQEALALFVDEGDDKEAKETTNTTKLTTTEATTTTSANHARRRYAQHETTLVILDSDPAPIWSKNYREFVRLSWDLQEIAIYQAGLMEDLQLVLFHPWATHETYGMVDEAGRSSTSSRPGDYTIRSPYPTVHLLRRVDVQRAVEGGYPNLETLPARNQAKLDQQGIEVCQRRLEECFQRHQS